MAYVEWLRVRRVARICAITFGVFLILEVLMRIVAQIVLPHAVQSNGMLAIDIAGFSPFVLVLGLITATIFGAPLAKENSGHLEIAWTKPISREALAIRSFGIDIAGTIIIQCMAMLAQLLAIVILTPPQLTLSPDGILVIIIAFAGPIAWYALLTT